ncbi:Ig-like domain-containing protein [Paenibacillus spongiae]|uniref:Ig-like domain-containing protein n=1 Tax=Paenibacillus spongiae TaxID=2909671 RepID=A0ABY5S8C8_9BACL|nr:Ig-like domain-containing protein [Paenibacillus spongiae]UVI29924.1 Ig-like domain-containing protein [Paenibacillus spongiae]
MISRPTSSPARTLRAALAAGLALVLMLSAMSGAAIAAEETVTGIAFETVPSPAKLYIDDETMALRVNAAISGATSVKDVTLDAVWTSSNTSAIKVDKGVLTAVSKGTSTIRAQYKGFTVSVIMTSEYKYDKITMKSDGAALEDKEEVKLGQDPSYTLTATKDDVDSEITKLASWTSSNEAVATVSEGKITLLAAGETTITAKYRGRSDSVKLKVTSPYKKLTISPRSLMEFEIGNAAKSVTVSAELIDGGTDQSLTDKVTWLSANSAVATVEKGVVTPVGAGTTTITADYLGVSDSFTVVVRPPFEAMRISPDQAQHILLKDKGTGIQFKVEVLDPPAEAEDVTSSATWTSDNVFAATVSDTGLVTPKAVGKTTIKAEYKGLSRQVVVNVYPTVSKLEAAKDKVEVFVDDNITLPKVNATSLTDEIVDVSDLVTWTSNDNSVVRLEKDKWVAKKVGTAVLTAEIDGETVTVKVAVNEKPLILIPEVTDMSIVIGQEVKLPKITVTYESGNEEDVSSLVTWKTTSTNILVKAPNVRGLVKTSATLTATYLGKSTTVRVTVEEEITKIYVEANSLLLNPGRSKSIKVTGVYKSGKSVSLGSKMNWTIDPDTLATVKGATVKALEEGTGKLTGSYQGKVVQIALIVKQKLKKLTASDKSLQLAIGGTGTFKITGEYENGRLIDATKSAVWTSSKASVVKVEGGVVTAVAKGTATIKAVFEGKSITMRVTVK